MVRFAISINEDILGFMGHARACDDVDKYLLRYGFASYESAYESWKYLCGEKGRICRFEIDI